ncbi:axonemal dynein light chain domain-containing protein 1 [Anableps anableps]
MSLSTARASSAPSSPREEQADVTDLNIQVPDQEIRKKEPLPVNQTGVPPELLLSLTSTVSSKSTQGQTAHKRNCESCEIRRPDGVWHHRFGRSKYKYFLEQPTSLTGAGRDISFLCDAVLTQRKMALLPPVNEDLSLSENVIPEEYRLVRNKGIQCLELYEDAFTVQLKDQEQKLRALPSLRPSGRLEVIQLMRMMDDMLEKAGVDEKSDELTELCQLEGLLELVKTEQNIYNIVFHELIRQVTVGCAERGQLLAKLRLRYQSLLDRIPRRLRSLHAEVVAQRTLDRRLIEEIYRIKASIQQINMELSKIKDHNIFVSQKIERAQHQLTEGHRETLSSSDIVQGYHRMYELHKTRLEDQLQQITEERDFWNQFTFSLALKMIKVKKLQLISELDVSEKGWSKTALHCLLYISTKEAQDLDNIVEATVNWKEQLINFMSELKSTEQAQMEQVTSVQQGIAKWSLLLDTQDKNASRSCRTVALKDWSYRALMLVLQCEEYQDEKQLLFQESLKELHSNLEKWLSMSIHLFERQTFTDAKSAVGPQTVKELDKVLSALLKQFHIQVSGESDFIEYHFSQPASKVTMPISDWLKLEEALFNWRNLAEEIFLHCCFTPVENQKDKNKPNLYTQTKKALDSIQEFTNTLFIFTESKSKELQEKVTEDPLLEPGDVDEDRDETEPESTERELIDHERPVLKLIGYDGNITQRYLDENIVLLTGTDELVLSPVTEEDNTALSILSTVVLLQKELSDSEVRVRDNELRALKAEEALHAALDKIQDLERQLENQPAPEPQSEDEAKKTPPPSPPIVTGPASPKSPTVEDKQASITTEDKKQ